MAIFKILVLTSLLTIANGFFLTKVKRSYSWLDYRGDKCKELRYIANGYYTSKYTVFGEVAKAFCHEGYTLIGPSTIECGKTTDFFIAPFCVSTLDHHCSIFAGEKKCQDHCVKNEDGLYSCACSEPGMELAQDGWHCQDINECAVNNFNCSHECVNLIGSAYCLCPFGLTLEDDMKTCSNDRCKDLRSIANGYYIFRKTLFGKVAEVVCNEGYKLIGLKTIKCENITDYFIPRSFCEIKYDRCKDLHSIANGHYVVKTTLFRKVAEVVCDEGYNLIGPKTIKCENNTDHFIPPICEFNCQKCEDLCAENEDGLYSCACTTPGMELAKDGKHCQDINECAVNNFNCSHECINIIGSAICICPPGFTLEIDMKTCSEISLLFPRENITLLLELMQLTYAKISQFEIDLNGHTDILEKVVSNNQMIQERIENMVSGFKQLNSKMLCLPDAISIPVN